MTTLEDLRAALAAAPFDLHLRLIYADALEEEGHGAPEGYRALGTVREGGTRAFTPWFDNRSHVWAAYSDDFVNHNTGVWSPDPTHALPIDWIRLVDPESTRISLWQTGNRASTVAAGQPVTDLFDALAGAFVRLPAVRKAALLGREVQG